MMLMPNFVVPVHEKYRELSSRQKKTTSFSSFNCNSVPRDFCSLDFRHLRFSPQDESNDMLRLTGKFPLHTFPYSHVVGKHFFNGEKVVFLKKND